MKKLLMILLLAGFAVTHAPIRAESHDEFAEFSEADQAELEKLIAELEQEAGTITEAEEAGPSEEVEHTKW